jgi:hypothetical protein
MTRVNGERSLRERTLLLGSIFLISPTNPALGVLPRAFADARSATADRKRAASPSTYCLHDFHAVTITQFMLPMAAAWHDFAVHFNGDSAFAMAGFGEQRCDRRGGRTFT